MTQSTWKSYIWEIDNWRSRVNVTETHLQHQEFIYDFTFVLLKQRKLKNNADEIEVLATNILITGREEVQLEQELDRANCQLIKPVR